MKRIGALCLAALTAALLLTACGGQKDGSDKAGPYTADTLQALVEAGAFSEELEGLDEETAFALYQLADYDLSREELSGCTVLRSAGATCEEAAVLTLAGEEQAEKAVTALEDYVDGQIAANRDYRPGEIPKLEGALIKRSGGTVLLAVVYDLDAANGALG